MGKSMRESSAVWFFCTQPFGLLLEDTVQATYRRYLKGNSTGNKSTFPWTRLVGYLWVTAFMVWSAPVWVYPLMQGHRPGIDDLSSFRVLASLLGR